MPVVSIKKPHHKQERSMSCLPACVKMLLDFLGESTEETTLRELLETTDDGTAVISVLELNTSLPDVKVEIYNWSVASLRWYLETNRKPCIVAVRTTALPHWNKIIILHAIVVHGFDNEHLLINDPFFDEKQFQLRRH